LSKFVRESTVKERRNECKGSLMVSPVPA